MSFRTTVTTSCGDVLGHDADGASSFLGIPYASDPVGALRFAPPTPHPGWSTPLLATSPGPAVPQPPSRLEPIMGRPNATYSEWGSLTLNVWTPDTDGRFPVLLWLHGGAWTTGSAGWDWYNGQRLATEGRIVVVTANYRLGPLGYLYLAGHGVDDAQGNYGLGDQALALRWVHQNIAAFGGDPDMITVAGQSAGAHAAIQLGARPDTKPLIKRLFLQSVPWKVPHQTVAQATDMATEFLELSGVPAAEQLRETPVDQLLETGTRLAQQHAVAGLSGAPTLGVILTSETPWENAFDTTLSGLDDTVDVLMGYTSRETSAFLHGVFDLAQLTDAQCAHILTAVLRDPEAADTYTLFRERDLDAEPHRILAAAATDAVFRTPTRDIATRRRAFAAGATHVYEFGFGNEAIGPCHCIDLPFLFDNLDAWKDAPMLADLPPRDARRTADEFSRAVARFVTTGDPGVSETEQTHTDTEEYVIEFPTLAPS
ncbi:carboxylesterase family protein [Nocardia beijingensis]|uniref:carboxylesterase/lipase family protein n=1 Tax=Nocardia beijingensis TaxID=95162 RepID=UPI0033C5EC20